MIRKIYILLLCFALSNMTLAQGTFDYDLEVIPVNFPNLTGLHSYAFAQHNGKWLVIGGRLDGLHARQPFNSFPSAQNNTDIYVIDVQSKQTWSASVNSLPTSIAEQLQATNMNFYQHHDTLVIIGGYAYSNTSAGHITFPNLTTVIVSDVINAVMNGSSITPYFQQLTDNNFAVTGAQLGLLNDTFYLVGGHRFDGRYNPMGNPTYTQTYTNQIRKFTLNNTAGNLSYHNYSTITDPVHLRRRDYNLLPQIFPDGTEGYTISSGVFQSNVDLPFLYPVDITANGHTPITGFNQYLSNYHSAKACLYDSTTNEMHNLFFGGMSQYYYQNGSLIQDNNVPFVKTISRLTRMADSTLIEVQMPIEMPALRGASAEFIPNNNLPHYASEIIKLSAINQDTILLGHIFGGIYSPSLHPFTNNNTNSTSADTSLYAVRLIRQTPTQVFQIDGNNPYEIEVSPNPTDGKLNIYYELEKPTETYYFLTTITGQIIQEGTLENQQKGKHQFTINLEETSSNQVLFLTVSFEHKFFITKKILHQ